MQAGQLWLGPKDSLRGGGARVQSRAPTLGVRQVKEGNGRALYTLFPAPRLGSEIILLQSTIQRDSLLLPPQGKSYSQALSGPAFP